jgi:hypothetical protein
MLLFIDTKRLFYFLPVQNALDISVALKDDRPKNMKASLSLPDYASLIRPTSLVLPELKFQRSQFDSIPITRLYDVSESLTERLCRTAKPIYALLPQSVGENHAPMEERRH